MRPDPEPLCHISVIGNIVMMMRMVVRHHTNRDRNSNSRSNYDARYCDNHNVFGCEPEPAAASVAGTAIAKAGIAGATDTSVAAITCKPS